jgi:hypothetical protein
MCNLRFTVLFSVSDLFIYDSEVQSTGTEESLLGHSIIVELATRVMYLLHDKPQS